MVISNSSSSRGTAPSVRPGPSAMGLPTAQAETPEPPRGPPPPLLAWHDDLGVTQLARQHRAAVHEVRVLLPHVAHVPPQHLQRQPEPCPGQRWDISPRAWAGSSPFGPSHQPCQVLPQPQLPVTNPSGWDNPYMGLHMHPAPKHIPMPAAMSASLCRQRGMGDTGDMRDMGALPCPLWLMSFPSTAFLIML